MNKMEMMWIYKRLSALVNKCFSNFDRFLLNIKKNNRSFALQIDKNQAELAHANFSILRKEAQSILDVVGFFLSLRYANN